MRMKHPLYDLTSLFHPRYIRSKTEPHGDEDGIAFKDFFPRISWVLRDCSGDDLDGQKPEESVLSIRSRAFMDKALEVRGYSDESERRNLLRKMIVSFFPRRDCFRFPWPSTSPEVPHAPHASDPATAPGARAGGARADTHPAARSRVPAEHRGPAAPHPPR